MDRLIDPFYAKPFVMFSFSHWAALLIIALFCAGLFLGRHKLGDDKKIKKSLRWGMALMLVFLELALQWWYLAFGLWSLQTSLPLHLCGISALLAAFELISCQGKLFELLYFWGLGGALQALITPDTAYDFPHLIFFIFFASHGLIIMAVLWLTLIEGFKPAFASIGKVFLVTNIYLLFIAAFNAVFGCNYLYICAKPSGYSLLDFLGPWPWYILSLEAAGLIICFLCYVPFTRNQRGEKRFPPLN